MMRLVLVRPPVVHLKADMYGSIPGIPAGMAYLAASVRQAGFDVRVLDAYGEAPRRFYTFRDRYRARGLTPTEAALSIAGMEPGAVGISVHCAAEHTMSCHMIAAIRTLLPDTPIIIGGYHATFLPEAFIEAGADFAVMGEGEKRLPALLRAIESGAPTDCMEGVASSAGVCERTSKYTVDLDSQPFAAVDLLPLENYWALGYSHGPFMGKYMNLLTSRGCPYNCAFCQAPAMSGGRWLRKSAPRVIEEIRFHMDTYGVRDFHIQDENFAIDRTRVESICRTLIEDDFGITFCFPSGLKMETLDEELLDLMIRAGCRYFSLSPETGSTRVLELMNKTASLTRVPQLIRKASGMGASTCAFFVAGYPGETDSDRRQTRAYIRRLARDGVDEVVMPILTPFPATAAMEEESLQGFTEYDELCFSPVWRKDYRRLNRFRVGVYLHFYASRLISHPIRVLRQLVNVFTGKARTKTEMTARRLFKDLRDRLFPRRPPEEMRVTR
jgi:anaerobic magnesium-protoporphyrin IX monomethyl ester cyclase